MISAPNLRTIAVRQVRRSPLVAVIVTLAVALTVTVSMIVAGAISYTAENTGSRVGPARLGSNAYVLFDSKATGKEACDALELLRRYVEGMDAQVSVASFRYVRAESTVGPVFMVGLGDFIGEWDIVVDEALGMAIGNLGGHLSVTVMNAQNRIESVQFHEVSGFAGTGLWVPSGWSFVNPKLLERDSGSKMGALLRFSRPGKKFVDQLHEIESVLPGCTVLSALTGQSILETEMRRTLLLWQAVSVIVLLAASSAVSCVLTVSFLGRKRGLGILKVLGATSRDFQRLMLIEALYMGGAGVPLGILSGALIMRLSIGAPALTLPTALMSATVGVLTLLMGIYLPMRLLRNATCDQLLNNKPVYAITNPSCAQCGLCGGF